jgi:hypothetical protein
MDISATIVTAAVTLLGVTLGGWLTVWNQDRLWRREHARQWRDIRLTAFQNFLTAYREYLAYVENPESKISAVPHPQRSGELMPSFDADGRSYKERLDATRMTVTLVSERLETRDTLFLLLRRVRALAGARGVQSPDELPNDLFRNLFAAHNAFVSAARKELGLPDIPDPLD